MTRSQHWKEQIRAVGWLLFALLLLTGPFNRAGLWEPVELRYAELSRRLSHQLFDVDVRLFADEVMGSVSLQQLGQGELPFTSAAFLFRVLGVHDYSGRLASLLWGFVAVISLWVLLGRLTRGHGRLFGVLALVSVPGFVWQSRMMLGDAATMGSLSLATTGLALALLDEGPWWAKASWLLLGGVGLATGQLCRGVLIGVAVPLLAVGIAGVQYAQRLGQNRLGSRKPLVVAMSCVAAAVAAAGFGGLELIRAAAGPSVVMGGTLGGPFVAGGFANEATNVLHAVFPWSVFLPAALSIATVSADQDDPESCREEALTTALLLIVVLTVGAMGALGARNVRLPFPAAAAAAGLCGVALSRGIRDGRTSKLVATSVAALGVVVYADFENSPEKLMQASGYAGAAIPSGFVEENRSWLRAALGVLVFGCMAVVIGRRDSGAAPFSRARRAELGRYGQEVLAGHFLSGMVLVETTLATTGLMVHAHERGWISVPFFAATLPSFGLFLRYAWVIPPLIVLVLPLVYVVVSECLAWLLSDGSSRRTVRGRAGVEIVTPARFDWRKGCGLRPMTVVGAALVVSGLLLTLGQVPRMSAQLSPKSALAHYRELAKHGEELALVGVDAQTARYYVPASLKSIGDVGEAALWLHQGETKRRYAAVEASLLGELNAAFRSHSGGKNLVLPVAEWGHVLLVTQPTVEAESNHNPLSKALPRDLPNLAHRGSGEFGGLVEVVGWELLDGSGQVRPEVSTGEAYRLRLVFRVLGAPRLEWQIFVHLDGQGRRQNVDHSPVGGAYPTTLWQAGDIIVDEVPIRLDAAWLPGSCRVHVGFFRGTTRLEVTSGDEDDDRLIVGELAVR